MQYSTAPLPLAAAAAALPIEEWDSYWPEEIDATDAERDRAAEVWVSLQGFDPASPEAVAARNTLRRGPAFDAGLLVALSAPATEFLHWFSRVAEWEHFAGDQAAPCIDDVGSEAWGWAIVDRARAGVAALGSLASQVALRPVRAAGEAA